MELRLCFAIIIAHRFYFCNVTFTEVQALSEPSKLNKQIAGQARHYRLNIGSGLCKEAIPAPIAGKVLALGL